MATPIIMPKFGQMTEESTIVEWFKKEGDRVAKGDMLFAVETDKSVMEVESFEEGTLLKIAVKTGISVPVQSVVGFLGKPGEAIPAIPVAASAPAAKPQTPIAAVPPPSLTTISGVTAAPAPAVSSLAPAPDLFRISPRAAALARASVIDPSPIKGTGPGGRVVEKDVKAYLARRGYDRLTISRAAKALAAKEGLDLLAIRADGRITVADVERAVAEKPVAMSKMRQVIAERLTQSVTTAPHFYVTVDVDMTDLVAHRNALKASGAPYTMTDFIAEAAVLCLKGFPAVNSSTDGKATRWSSRVNLGLAVSLDEGLVVPVLFDADALTMAELSARSKDLFAKARTGKLAPDEMSVSTFTISNMGMLDVENFTAIINPGESAILAVSSVIDKPVARNGAVVIRSMMKMTLSSDHRLIDGAMAARFANAIKKKLEDTESWKSLTSS
jgi:pyruvate dehydrogenase E2 component (dihydrolipoyllysine-residue acetyltransferase)